MDVTNADDADLRESMSRFEAAVAAQEPQLDEPVVGRLLVALDGSNQDRTAEGLAVALARRLGAAMAIVEVRGRDWPLARREYPEERARLIAEQGVEIAAARAVGGGDDRRPPYAHILEAREREECGVIVLCAPFHEDFAELGNASVGTTLDVLMHRAPVPLLVAREPRDEPAECFANVLLPVTPFGRETVEAAAWALRVVDPDGRIRMVAVIDRETLELASARFEDFDSVDEESLAGLRRPEVAGLVAALQRRTAELGIACRVSVRGGEAVPEIVALATADAALLVAACPRRPSSNTFQHVQTLVRQSSYPVLVP